MPFKYVAITVTPLHLTHMSFWNETFQYATVTCDRCGPLKGFSQRDEIFSTVSGLTPSEQFLHDHEDYHDPEQRPDDNHLKPELWLPSTTEILESLIQREVTQLGEAFYAEEPCMLVSHGYMQGFLASALATVIRSIPENLYYMYKDYQNRRLDCPTPGS